jgi:hypothetical protein
LLLAFNKPRWSALTMRLCWKSSTGDSLWNFTMLK